MARHFVATIARALRETEQDTVHTHAGEYGRPYVCEDAHCTSPGLDVHAS